MKPVSHMSLQEIFDTVYTHLMRQNKRSSDKLGDCAYRGYDGTMCAVGRLIPDDRYTERLEGAGVHSVHVLRSLGLHETSDPSLLGLLSDLQTVHDCDPVSRWHKALAKVGKRYGLAVPKGRSDLTAETPKPVA